MSDISKRIALLLRDFGEGMAMKEIGLDGQALFFIESLHGLFDQIRSFFCR